jgi:hypothetical protein
MRQVDLLAAQHFLSLFSGPFIRVKFLYNYGLGGGGGGYRIQSSI